MNFTMQFATPDRAEMRASGGQGAGPGQVSGLQAGPGGLWLGLEGRFMPAFYRTKGFTRRGAGHTGKAPAANRPAQSSEERYEYDTTLACGVDRASSRAWRRGRKRGARRA